MVFARRSGGTATSPGTNCVYAARWTTPTSRYGFLRVPGSVALGTYLLFNQRQAVKNPVQRRRHAQFVPRGSLHLLRVEREPLAVEQLAQQLVMVKCGGSVKRSR